MLYVGSEEWGMRRVGECDEVGGGAFCIVEWRYLSISDANIQKTATRLQATGEILTFQHSTKMSVSLVKAHSMSFMLSSGIFHSMKAIE